MDSEFNAPASLMLQLIYCKLDSENELVNDLTNSKSSGLFKCIHCFLNKIASFSIFDVLKIHINEWKCGILLS